MIPEAEVRRRAAAAGLDPLVIDRDHALGVVLWALSTLDIASSWLFKGGTCLRKAYLDDYRFSEEPGTPQRLRYTSFRCPTLTTQTVSRSSSIE